MTPPFSLPLTAPRLEAELTTTRWGQSEDAPSSPTLRFVCPLCGDHSHLIPYREGQAQHARHPKIGHVWGHVSGTTLADLTLAPSYLADSTRDGVGCRLHAFVRAGVLQVLGDSHGPR